MATRVFISYAREDRPAVREIVAQLEARGHDVWIDWDDIEPSEHWMDAIRGAISAADAVVFAGSPSAFASDVCAQELAYAAEQRKRLIPLVVADVEHLAAPLAVAELQWIFLREQDDPAAGLAQLDRALQLDLDLLRVHASVLTRAQAWEADARPAGRLLRGEELRAAQQWLARAAAGVKPEATPLQQAFVAASSGAAARRQRRYVAGALAVALAALGLAVFAFAQRDRARHETRVARSRELAARAEGAVATAPEAAISLALASIRLEPTRQATHALLHALDASRLRRRLRAGGPVAAVAWSPRGDRLLAGRGDGALVEWDVARLRRRWTTPRGMPVRGVAFSPDGRLLAVSRWSDATCSAEVRDAATGRLLRTLDRGRLLSGCPALTAWARVGHRLAVVVAGGLLLVDADSGRQLGRLSTATPSPALNVYGLAVSADGRRAAVSGADDVIRIVRLPDGKLLTTASSASLKPSSVAFSPRGDQLAFGAQGGAELVDLRYPGGYGRGHLQYQLRGSTYFVNGVTWSPDGSLVAGATSDPATYVWNAVSGRPVAALRGAADFETSVAFSPRGALASGSDDGLVRIWAPDPDAPLERVHVGSDSDVFFGADAAGVHLAAFETAGTRALVDDRGRAVARVPFPPDATQALARGGLLGTVASGQISLSRLRSGVTVRAMPIDAASGRSVDEFALSADARVAALVARTPAEEQAPGQLVVARPGGDRLVRGVDAEAALVSADGRLVVAVVGARTTVIDAARLSVVRRLSGTALAFAPRGDGLALLREDGAIAIEGARSGRVATVLHSVPAGPRFGFSPDGRFGAASGDDGTVVLWDLADGTPLRSWHAEEQYAYGGERIQLTAPVLTAAGRVLVGSRDAVLAFDGCDACLDPRALERRAVARLREIAPR